MSWYFYAETPRVPPIVASTQPDPLVLTEEKALQRDAEAKAAPRSRFISLATLLSVLRGIAEAARGEGKELTDKDLKD